MDQIVDKAKLSVEKNKQKKMISRPTREEAEAAVRTLLLWSGDDPSREGLQRNPCPRGESLWRIVQRL